MVDTKETEEYLKNQVSKLTQRRDELAERARKADETGQGDVAKRLREERNIVIEELSQTNRILGLSQQYVFSREAAAQAIRLRSEAHLKRKIRGERIRAGEIIVIGEKQYKAHELEAAGIKVKTDSTGKVTDIQDIETQQSIIPRAKEFEAHLAERPEILRKIREAKKIEKAPPKPSPEFDFFSGTGGVDFFGTGAVDISKPTEPIVGVVTPFGEPYKPPITTRAKIAVSEYRRDPQAFIRKYGDKAATAVLEFISKPSRETEERITEEQTLKVFLGEQEFFGGTDFSKLTPYQLRGTAEVTKVTFLPEEELKEKYPFGAEAAIRSRIQKDLDFKSNQVINKYIDQFEPEFETKVNREANILFVNYQDKINSGELSLDEATKKYEKDIERIANKYSNEFQRKVFKASRGELDQLTTTADDYIKLTSKDLRVKKAVHLIGINVLTGAALTFGIGALPKTAGTIVGGTITAATLYKTPEFVESYIESPKAFGIETGSFLIGGAVGGEALRLKAGQPTVTGRAVGRTVKISKSVNRSINQMVDDVIAGKSPTFAFAGVSQVLVQIGKKKKRTALDKLGDHLEGLKNKKDFEQNPKKKSKIQDEINTILDKLDREFVRKIKKAPKEKQRQLIDEYNTFRTTLSNRGIYKEIKIPKREVKPKEPKFEKPKIDKLTEGVVKVPKERVIEPLTETRFGDLKTSKRFDIDIAKGKIEPIKMESTFPKVKMKDVTKTTAKPKQKMRDITKTTELVKPKVKVKQKSREIQQQKNLQKLMFGQPQMIREQQKQGFVQLLKQTSLEKQQELLKQAPKLAQPQLHEFKQQQREFQDLIIGAPTLGKFRPLRPRPKKPKPRIKIKIEPKLLDRDLIKIKKPKKQKGYDAYIKSQNKFIKANRVPLTKRQAQDMGAWVTDKTLARTFQVRPTKKTAKNPRIQVPPNYAGIFGFKFRPYQRMKGLKRPLTNTFIERKGYGLDSAGEIRQITAARFIAQQRKKSNQKIKIQQNFNKLFTT